MLTFDFKTLKAGYERSAFSPSEVIDIAFERIGAAGDNGVWISRVEKEEAQAAASRLSALSPSERGRLPLYGLPFAVKDCIDVAGQPTTCACPEFGYTPEVSASAVARAIAAGAVYFGKTNMDQFATGLVGTRTPYGIARNPFNPDYIPGGSSSGSAVAVSAGFVSFAFGTDTGGSGRVPASYTNTIGLKPTVGRISPKGLVNACRTIDCISIYALTGADALDVLNVTAAHDPEVAYSRETPHPSRIKAAFTPGASFRFGVPSDSQLEFFGDPDTPGLYQEAVSTLEEMGGKAFEIDYASFLEVNRMMFFGPFVSERAAAFGRFLADHPKAGDATVRAIIEAANAITSVETWKMLYRLEELKLSTNEIWQAIDVLLLPTVGRLYKIADIEADPLKPNFNNGYYTNFANPFDLAAVAVPNGFARDRVPAAVTFVAPAFSEMYLCGIADAFRKRRVTRLGAYS